MTYAEKLKHPEWQKKRLKIMERDGFKCRGCGSKEKTLHVHHRFYLSGRQPWEYSDGVFETLCDECHRDFDTDTPNAWDETIFERLSKMKRWELLKLVEIYESIGSSGLEILKEDTAKELLLSMIKALDHTNGVGFREGRDSALGKEDE